LQGLIGEILAQQNRTNMVVTSIRTAAESMAHGATQQAGELVSATELVERMNVEIERVSHNAQNAADSSRHTEASAVDGVKAVGNIITGMEQLRANVQAGAKKVKSLGERSMEITSIVSAINRVSEQTNMLALNAAIEAARAGEHGRGFSVVAEEVRKLAERTANSTLEIDKLVKSIQSETNETVSAIEVQTDVVERESAMVGQAGSSLARIREVSTTSATLVNEISTVARQQVESTRSVVRVMEQVSAIAQKTQNEAQNTAVNVAELVKASDSLAGSIRRFRLS
jgi:twitching motility protein PilJ